MKWAGVGLMVFGVLLVLSMAVTPVVVGVTAIFLGWQLFKSGAASEFGRGFRHSFHRSGTGIALSPERRSIKLQAQGRSKEYGFADIRGWEGQLHTGGMATQTFGGFAHASAATAGNLAQARANRRASGLFVTVADVHNPLWRIDMLNQHEQAMWMEILRQNLE